METLHGTTVKEQLQEIEHIKKSRELAAKLKDIKIAMLTTVNENGKLHSRPMYTFDIKDDGIIWMFIAADSQKVEELHNNTNVLLNYSNPQQNIYVTVNGKAEIVEDSAKIEELWSDRFKAWFPYGKEDKNLKLLKVEPHQAEYWDTPDLLLTQVINLVKNTLGGNPYMEGENKTLVF